MFVASVAPAVFIDTCPVSGRVVVVTIAVVVARGVVADCAVVVVCGWSVVASVVVTFGTTTSGWTISGPLSDSPAVLHSSLHVLHELHGGFPDWNWARHPAGTLSHWFSGIGLTTSGKAHSGSSVFGLIGQRCLHKSTTSRGPYPSRSWSHWYGKFSGP